MTTRMSGGERREQIAAAARAIALEDGLAGLTLRSIATRLGVASGLVAHYEPSMEALVARTFAAIAAHELAEVLAGLAAAPDAAANAASPRTPAESRDALARLVEQLLDPARDAVSSVWADAWSLGRRLPLVAAAAREGMDAWTDAATRILRPLAGGEADRIALQLFALVDSTTAYALVGYRSADERSGLVFASLESALGLGKGDLRNP